MAEMETNMQSLDPIPTDVLFDILLMLPAKSVARFVCVSKLWAKVIRNQDFIRAFSFRSSLQNKQPRLLFAFKTEVKGYQENWYFFSKSTNVSTPLCKPKHTVLPSEFAAHWPDMLALYRNGQIQELKALVEEPKPKVVEEPPDFESSTVCHLKTLRYQKPSYVHGLISFLYGQELVICNPSLGKTIALPNVESSRKIIRSFLGYDPIDRRYKVLCLTYLGGFCEHQVLTLGDQNCVWRMIQCSIHHYPGNSSVCIDGGLYYIASTSFTGYEPVLVSFDLRSESLEIASVFLEGLESPEETSLINYHGKVAVVSTYYLCGYFDLWVLEDAKKQRWSKERINIDTSGLKIVGTFDIGEIIFAPINFEELVVYFLDRKSNRTRRVELEGTTKHKFRVFYQVFTFLHHVESVMFI